MAHEISRRQALGMGLAATAVVATPLRAQGAATPLKSLAQARGIRFGSSVGAGAANSLAGSIHDPAYRDLLRRDCGVLVHENELKWYVLRTEPTGFNFDPADRIMQFAHENDLGVRGHTLLWNRAEFTPAWLQSHDFGTRPASAAEELITTHIRTVMERYRGRIYSWDVVNETIDPETGELRDTVFSRLLGERVMDIAFNAAREADPRAQLVYNDYMGWDNGQDRHRDGVMRLVDGMATRGTPIDALGVQSHIWAAPNERLDGYDPDRDARWRDFLTGITRLDLELAVTEFDVNGTNLPFDIEERDAEIAALAEHYLTVMLSYTQTRDLLVWGMADHYSWLQNLWPRPDGEPKRPSPYDASFRAKPLRAAIANALENAPAR